MNPNTEFHKIFPMAEWQNTSRPWTEKSLGGAVIAGESLKSILDLASKEEKNDWNNLTMSYAPIPGSKPLRSQIAKLYPGLSPENIVVFSGAQEAINALYSVLLTTKNSTVLGLTPCYSPLNNCAKAYGGILQELPLKLDIDNRWQLDIEKLLTQLEEQKPNILTVNFPHNPTGYLPTPLEWDSITEACAKNKVTLISDEVFRGLEFSQSPQIEPACLKIPHSFSLRSISKAFGGQALRIGWVATQRKEDIEKLTTVKRYFSVCPSALDDFLATILLRNRAHILKKNNRKLHDQSQILKDMFSDCPLLNIPLPAAGPVCFPNLENTSDAQEFCLNFLKETGLRLEPGFSFGPHFSSHFRLSIGGDNLEKNLGLLKKFIKK